MGVTRAPRTASLARGVARWYTTAPMTRHRPLVAYLTPHGNGHAVRVCDILMAVRRRRPEIPILVVSRHSTSFLRSRLPADAVTFRAAAFDSGMAQIDSVRCDMAASLAAAIELVAARPALIRRERAWLSRIGAGAVLSDIPAIPIEAAAAAGVPALASGNFSWNWIYEHLAGTDSRWNEVAAAFRSGYAACDLLLRLPFHEPMDAFRRIVDLPLVASPGRPRRAEIAAATGADPSGRWVLLAFSSLDWPVEAQRRAATAGAELFTVLPMRWRARGFRAVDRRRFAFADVLASCDVVVTKPGFGILSEAIVNRVPIVYVNRPEWPEAALLIEGVRRYARGVEISAADLYAGRLESAIEAAVASPPPLETLPDGGADTAAEWLLSLAAS